MRSFAAVLLFALASATFADVVAAQSRSLLEELKSCARIAESDARFTCFDKLGQRALADESKSAVAASPVPVAPGAAEPASASTARDVVEPSAVAPEAPSAVTGTASVAPAAPVAAAAPTAASVENSKTENYDEIGGYEFQSKRSEEEEIEKQAEEGMRTRVVLCQRSRENIWYFKLENGQIWKQIDRQSLSFQGCDFGAVVANDGLGYVLRIDGRKGKIRIKRRK